MSKLRVKDATLLSLLLLLLIAIIWYAQSASSRCEFSGDRIAPSAFDRVIAARLRNELSQYRLTTKELPQPPTVYSVTVKARTAVIKVARQSLDFPYAAAKQGNDFRYAQVWQRVYANAYHSTGACVRTILIFPGGKPAIQRCWGSEGPVCD